MGVERVLVDVRDVEDRLHGEQMQVVDRRLLVLVQAERAGAMAFVQALEYLLGDLELLRTGFVALGLFL